MAHDATDLNSRILAELQSLRQEVASLRGNMAPMGSASKASKGSSKPKDPNAPKRAPNAWIVFTGVVRETLKAANLPAGAQAQQFAKYLNDNFENAYAMDPDTILSHHEGWEAPPVKPRAKKADTPPEGDAKPKKTITPEHHAKMMEGKRKAAEARKLAEEQAKQAQVAEVEDNAPEVASKPSGELKPMPWKGKKALLDSSTNGLWLRAEGEGLVKGKWLGVLSQDKKSVDSSVPDPDEA